VRSLFKKYQVLVISNLSIRGCYCDSKMSEQAWWPSDREVGAYSSLCFAILEDDKAEAIMKELEKNPIATDPGFPARAFLMNVEKML